MLKSIETQNCTNTQSHMLKYLAYPKDMNPWLMYGNNYLMNFLEVGKH